MQNISDVEKAITLNEELLEATKKRIRETAAKLSEAQSNVKKITADITVLKEKRRQALVRGGYSKSLNDSLKKLEGDLELESETVTGLQKFLAELQQEENSLRLKLSELPKRILQLQSVQIAKKYNTLSERLAGIAKELNAVHYKLDASFNGKQGRTVFLPDGLEFLDKVIRLTFDDEALDIDGYIRKNVTNFPYEPSDDQKYFYKWQAHCTSPEIVDTPKG